MKNLRELADSILSEMSKFDGEIIVNMQLKAPYLESVLRKTRCEAFNEAIKWINTYSKIDNPPERIIDAILALVKE